jgi:hypothetical protein
LQAIAISIVVAAVLSSILVLEVRSARKNPPGGTVAIVITALVGAAAIAVCLLAIFITGFSTYTPFSAPRSAQEYVAETQTWGGQTSVSIYKSHGPVYEPHWLASVDLQEGYTSIEDGDFKVTEGARWVSVHYTTVPGSALDEVLKFHAG